MPGNSIDQEVGAALRRAREIKHMTEEQFGLELSRFMQYRLGPEAIASAEQGGWVPSASVLVAAARIAEQPVSALLGESELYDRNLPALEKRIERLERLAEQSGRLD